MDDNSKYNELTPEEEYVILRKGTEYPFTGTLLDNKKKVLISVKDAMPHFTAQKTNLNHTAAGLVLTMR